jgi:hypothetical protein
MGTLVRSWHLITGAAILSYLVLNPEARAALIRLLTALPRLIAGTVRLARGG